jgi:methionine aminopeptidase
MYEVCQLARQAVNEACAFSQNETNVSTADIDNFIYDFCLKHKVYPSCYNYKGYPATICTSVNGMLSE